MRRLYTQYGLIHFILLPSLLILSIFAGWTLKKSAIETPIVVKQSNQKCEISQFRQSKFSLINPLLTCEVTLKKEFLEYMSLSDKVSRIIDTHKASKDIINASVYFHELNSGQWFNVAGNELYLPGSLLKVPIMIAYLKLAESNPDVLNMKYVYDGSYDLDSRQYFKPALILRKGQVYSVMELIERMIIYSENNPINLLGRYLNPQLINDVYGELGLPSPNYISQNPYSITPKSYSYFLRVLYNSTYLNREMSEKALSLLINSTFAKGIVGGLPPNIEVANKFGENYRPDNPSVKELHDCGIIYDQESPYILCIMTKGYNPEFMSKVLREISTVVYRERKKK